VWGTAETCRWWTDRNLKVDKLLCKGAHLVVEAELILAWFVGGKDEVALSLPLAVHDVFAIRASNLVVDIERSSGLHL
jgi:hypothetical protein